MKLTMKEETCFINELMHHIIDGVNIPKVQVERAVSPIIGLFAEAIIEELFKHDDNYSGNYKLITPEFPLKKSNNQSTNIDYLLINESKQFLVFFELKTDPSSLKKNQLEVYRYYRRKVSKFSAKFMQNDLEKILKASSKKSKYKTVFSSFNSKIQFPDKIKKIIILYLVPQSAVKKISIKDEVDFVFSFSDLPETIHHKYVEFWSIIRKHLVYLDSHFEHEKFKTIKTDPLKVIVNNIHNYLTLPNVNSNPISVQIGNTGEGTHPNYQVEFEDGSIQTFRFNGKKHSVSKFRSSNLNEKHLWNEIKNLT